MPRLHTKRFAAAGIAALMCISVASCSSSSSSDSSDAQTASELPSVSVDTALAVQVPDKYKSKGTLINGAEASYAPNEFIDEDGKTVIGLDVDLTNAIAQKLGLESETQNADFGTIILGVNSGKFDMGASSFTINSERIDQVNMVQYLNAGTSWAVASGNPKGVDLDSNICGMTVAVQKDTVQVDQLTDLSQQCTDQGQAEITQVVELEQSKATADLMSGKADAMLADSPVTAYAIEQSDGALEAIGDIEDAAPYGIVIAKDDTDMADLVSQALEQLKDDGTYDAILEKWGNEAGAVSEFTVNPSIDN